MTAAPAKAQLPIMGLARTSQNSQDVLRAASSNEMVFGVVGHIGSGASEVAKQLKVVLERRDFEVEILKARDEILGWASRIGRPAPPASKSTAAYVTALQDLGDEMRRSIDQAAVAISLVSRIRTTRATKMAATAEPGVPVEPDGSKRAYILDAIRHPAEAELLRQVYHSAFVLVGVVCDEETRRDRLGGKLTDAGHDTAITLMRRDAKAGPAWGQRVSDAFETADVFLDNTPNRSLEHEEPNPDWTIPDQLSRLIKIITRSEVIRPTPHETAMHAAHGARMRSACFSRQVGAALLDAKGNLIATGTNEVPKAGGGVYGPTIDLVQPAKPHDHRCAFTTLRTEKFCASNREQRDIMGAVSEELGRVIPGWNSDLAAKVDSALRDSPIHSLIEFSRAVHAEMDAILAVGRAGDSTVGARLYVTTFPCHYCARHIVAAGIHEVQYIEPYPKSRALKLHDDSISTEPAGWKPPEAGGRKVLFHPFTGVAPRLYERAFRKDIALKDETGRHVIGPAPSDHPWQTHRVSYAQLEANLARTVGG